MTDNGSFNFQRFSKVRKEKSNAHLPGFNELVGLLDDDVSLRRLLLGHALHVALSDTGQKLRAIEFLLGTSWIQAEAEGNLRKWVAGLFKNFVHFTKPDYIFAPHHLLMIEQIAEHALIDNGRLFIGMPPRHGKSELCSVRLPAWYLGNHPDHEVIHVSHSAELSNVFSRQVRNLVRSPRFRELFPGFNLSTERKSVNEWKTTAGGGFKSLGVGGGVTGHGCDLLILDDPHKEGDAESLAVMDRVYDWYATAARTRLSPGASIIFLMTRWHPLDLAGRLLEGGDDNSDDWHQLVLPAIAGEDDLLGRAPGEALWPERFDIEALERIKQLDDRHFQALFQNNPRGADDVMFDVGKVLEISGEEYPRLMQEDCFWTFDVASTIQESSDYTVMARWFYDGETLHLLYSERIRATFPAVRDRIIALYELYPADLFVFPADILELLMMQELRHSLASARIHSVSMQGDKVQKATPVATLLNNGRFAAYYEGGDNRLWLAELANFPFGRYDDCVDTASLAVHHLGIGREIMVLINRERERDKENR